MQEENRTFVELEIPFPLFDAAAKFAQGYAGEIVCDLCHQSGLGFTLQSAYLWEECSRCGARNGLPVDGDATHTTCHACRNLLRIPKFATKRPKVCYACLRSGRVCITHVTEFGMISWEQVVSGVTHGTPIKPETSFDIVPLEEGWFGVRVPAEYMWELTRTPVYSHIQSEHWNFCCERPMVYVGEWGKAKFKNHASDGNSKAFFDAIVEDATDYLWDALEDDKPHGDFGLYVFHCPICDSYRAHWDMF